MNLNLVDVQVEVCSFPLPDEKIPRYRDVQILTGEKLIPLMINGQTIAQFPASALLPPV